MPLENRLSDYDRYLIVVTDAKVGERDTSFGKRDTRSPRLVSGGWKSIGEIPIFVRTVQQQIDEVG